MTQIQHYKKPELAVIAEAKKLRDYNDEQRLAIADKIVQGLILDLAVGKNADVDVLIRSTKFIFSTCGKWTPDEIQKAFNMYINRELGNTEVFQQLNPVVIGNVMHLYDAYKKEHLTSYKRQQHKQKLQEQQPSDQEKEFIMIEAVDRIERDFRQHGTITESCFHVYDYLFEKGELPTDREYKLKMFAQAEEIRMNELLQERHQNPSDYKSITATIKNIKNDRGVVITAKRLVLEDYFTEKQVQS